MNRNLFKTMAATVCVVVTSVSVFKAYNVSNQSEANMLLKENVEALSDPEIRIPCVSAIGGCLVNAVDAHGIPRLLSIWGHASCLRWFPKESSISVIVDKQ